jgi:hypothetical protein
MNGMFCSSSTCAASLRGRLDTCVRSPQDTSRTRTRRHGRRHLPREILQRVFANGYELLRGRYTKRTEFQSGWLNPGESAAREQRRVEPGGGQHVQRKGTQQSEMNECEKKKSFNEGEAATAGMCQRRKILEEGERKRNPRLGGRHVLVLTWRERASQRAGQRGKGRPRMVRPATE